MSFSCSVFWRAIMAPHFLPPPFRTTVVLLRLPEGKEQVLIADFLQHASVPRTACAALRNHTDDRTRILCDDGSFMNGKWLFNGDLTMGYKRTAAES
ncbi:unnamed protein product [Soboliphyme baturini]|uniref:Secreted protein n=1 Tax=Soboliphyme baturini TaxID=241478 RepID=A0A183IZ80_9BILA|nr:unnamed protein product [Soboliphyme baturini]